ncbi:hypothetical protein BC940DRAFT_234230 [Gongronella butleri]|nr:hypothetical protein BC940DRAFT_234230 [Gongronella butleri]
MSVVASLSSDHHNPYYDDGYYGGGRGGDRNTDLNYFLMSPYVKMAWIAFFALLAYWAFVWFVRHLFGRGYYAYPYTTTATTAYAREDPLPAAASTVPAAAGDQQPPQQQMPQPPQPQPIRLTRVSTVLGELVLLLLGVLVLNTIGQGSTRIVMILTWVYFGFAVFFSIFEAAKESPMARFLFGLIFFGIAMAIGILSFVYGFHTSYDYRR